MIDPMTLMAIYQAGSSIYGALAQRKQQKEQQERARTSLEELLGLQRQEYTEDIDYRTALAQREAGESSAVSGMTGSPALYKLGNIESQRQKLLRDIYWKEMIKRKQFELSQKEAERQAEEQAKGQMWEAAGKVGGQILSSYLSPSTTIPSSSYQLQLPETKYSLLPPSAYKQTPSKSWFSDNSYNPYKRKWLSEGGLQWE